MHWIKVSETRYVNLGLVLDVHVKHDDGKVTLTAVEADGKNAVLHGNEARKLIAELDALAFTLDGDGPDAAPAVTA